MGDEFIDTIELGGAIWALERKVHPSVCGKKKEKKGGNKKGSKPPLSCRTLTLFFVWRGRQSN
jgi:hypothetical protein